MPNSSFAIGLAVVPNSSFAIDWRLCPSLLSQLIGGCAQLFFFFWHTEEKGKSVSHTVRKTAELRLAENRRRQRRLTQPDPRTATPAPHPVMVVSPSEPRAPGNSNMVEATARAATHARIGPHRRRHACSTRRRINCVSLRALALANWVVKAWVSRDQRPPTSSARTTR